MDVREKYSVCVIGLGAMGMGAALSCLRAGLETYGADVVEANREKLRAAGAAGVAERANGFASGLDAVMLMVVNAAQARDVFFAEPALAEVLRPGAAVLLSATMSPDDARSVGRELEERGLLVLDAPTSGGAAKAASGELTVMASGKEEAFSGAKRLLDAVASKVYNLGSDLGTGSTVKIIHQLLAGVHIAAAAEAMAMASRAGVPLETMYDVVMHSAGNSWMFENRMRHVLDGDYSPLSKVDIFVKDLGLVAEVARSLKFPASLASTALNMFIGASCAGHGGEDDSAVIKTFPGIRLP